MRFAVATVTAIIITSTQLRIDHSRFPFGDRRNKALGLWALLSAADGAVAALAVLFATTTGHGTAGNVVGWATIGILAPLGLRSPIYKTTEYFGRQVKPGITYVYDLARTRIAGNLDERMSVLRRHYREGISRAMAARGWDYGTLLPRLEEHLQDRRGSKQGTPQERQASKDAEDSILHAAYLAGGQATSELQLSGLARVFIDNRLTGLIDDVCGHAPTQHERSQAAEARARAEDYRSFQPTTARGKKEADRDERGG